MTIKAKRLRCFCAMLLICITASCFGQDTVKLTLPQTENIFLHKNLSLLAEKYNIDIARAQIIQAGLYNNPNLLFTGNIYNPDRKKALDISNRTGQYSVEANQLITLAGKRNKQIQLAHTNAAMSENNFLEVLRTLRYVLRTDFYKLHFLQKSAESYQYQIGYLEKLNTAYEELQSKGIVTLKDAVRIKSLLYSLKTEQANLLNEVNNLNADLRLLLSDNAATIIADADEHQTTDSQIKDYPLNKLIDTALANRNDLRFAENTVLYNKQNYALQKALAVPDLTLGAQFDKRGSFVDNASFFSVAMDIPFFNRNQGNIKAAKIGIGQSELVVQRQQIAVENEVRTAYQKAVNTEKMLLSFDPDFKNQLDKLLQGVTDNFQRKNISILEFIDFYESYRDNIVQLNQLQSTRHEAIEDLHLAIGKTIFN